MPDVPVNLGSRTASGLSLKQRMEQAAKQNSKERLMLLLDVSGSMDGYFNGAQSKLDASKKAVELFLNSCDRRISAVGAAAFSDDVQIIAEPIFLYSTITFRFSGMRTFGGTNMSEGLERMNQIDLTRVILVSDGQPNSASRTLTVAGKFVEKKIPIDCIYIGPIEGDGSAFLQQIAEMTGGHFFNVEDFDSYTKTLSKLEYKNRLQLEHK